MKKKHDWAHIKKNSVFRKEDHHQCRNQVSEKQEISYFLIVKKGYNADVNRNGKTK